MRVRLAQLVWLPILATLAAAAPVPAAPGGAVAVDVSAGGARLGRLIGQLQGRVAYFSLDDIGRLVGGRVRRTRDGAQAALLVGGKALEVRRDAARVRAGGRLLDLTAPVRVWRGAWTVPGDLLVRALPGVLGKGVHLVPASTTAGAAGAPRASPTPGRASAAAEPAQAPDGPAPPPAIPAAPRSGRVLPVSAPAAGPPRVPIVAVAPSAVPAPPPAPGPPVAVSGPAAAVAPAVAVHPRAPVHGGDALELRYRSYPAYTRVVVEGERPLEPRIVESRGGLLVSLVGSPHRGAPSVRAVRDGLVSTLELGEAGGTATLRIGFERAPASRKVHRLDDPPRLVLDFYRPAPGGSPAAAAAVPAPAPPAPTDAVRTIVIDPGHGGHDPGAIGPSGLQEKELTLDVGRRVAALVQEDLGVRALLTRSQDRFIALRERTAFANREKADLFVSIHVNSAPAMQASGAETYFLSSEATDNAARAAAAAENKVIALESSARGGSRDLLRSILWDLAQSDFQQESSRLAETVQSSLDRALRLPSRGVKQAPFYVLGGAAMPAILAEIGFITNPSEEQRLRDDGYRDRIARAIAAGIGAYKQSYDRRTGAVARR